MAFMTPLPLLVGMVAEAAYLLFYADSRWYAARLAQKFDGEIEARRNESEKNCAAATGRRKCARASSELESVRRGIGENAKADADWFREVLRKLDFLLEKWLQFATKDVQFQNYLGIGVARRMQRRDASAAQRHAFDAAHRQEPAGARTGRNDSSGARWRSAADATRAAQKRQRAANQKRADSGFGAANFRR